MNALQGLMCLFTKYIYYIYYIMTDKYQEKIVQINTLQPYFFEMVNAVVIFPATNSITFLFLKNYLFLLF